MKVLKLMVLAATTCIAAISCSDNSKTTLEGDLKDDFKEVVLYRISPQNVEPFDTIAVVDQKFHVELQMDSADFVLAQLSQRFRIPLFIQPGEKVKIEVEDLEDMTYNVSGSEESQRIERINEINLAARKEIDRLNQESQMAMQDSNFAAKKAELDSAFQKLVNETSQKYKDMIDEEPGSVANMFIFSQSIAQMPLISAQEDFEYFEKVGEGLQQKYPNLSHTKNYMNRLELMRKELAVEKELANVKASIAPGNEVPEIALENPQGQVMKLSDLRGKVVLVDFWAAWCRPCRAENPNLVRMYEQYKSKGFEVYSVSLDGLPNQQDPKEAWTKAIAVDKLVWDNHVSDLKGWETSVIEKFGFRGIPYTVLVGRDGKIIATELRGPELEAKLKEVL